MNQENLRLGQAEQALHAFVAAWLAPDATERRRQLEQCWSENSEFLAPNADSRGRDALAQTMASETISVPTNARIDLSEISEHHGWFRYTWKVVGESGKTLNTGLHVAQLDDAGRLRRVIAFYGPTPEPR